MNNTYLGTLEFRDPLYEILFSQVCPEVNAPVFHVNGISRMVYKYTEEKSGTAIIGKFFSLDDTREDRITRIKGEFDNLRMLRQFGFDTQPNYVVRPFCQNEKIGLALVEEFVRGKDLDHYIKKAIYRRDTRGLKSKLRRLGSFLYALHTRTMSSNSVGLDEICLYFQKILGKLCRQGLLSDEERREFLRLMDRWLGLPSFQSSRSVIVHGDATITNFIFTGSGDVAAIDLERMRSTDRVFDVGMVCGEMKHAFLWRTGDKYSSESYIRAFLEGYASHYHDPSSAFREVTLRNPFYMAMTELRIARNNYLDWNYRKMLVCEAMDCLKWGIRLI